MHLAFRLADLLHDFACIGEHDICFYSYGPIAYTRLKPLH